MRDARQAAQLRTGKDSATELKALEQALGAALRAEQQAEAARDGEANKLAKAEHRIDLVRLKKLRVTFFKFYCGNFFFFFPFSHF